MKYMLRMAPGILRKLALFHKWQVSCVSVSDNMPAFVRGGIFFEDSGKLENKFSLLLKGDLPNL